jgi:hypothetical protein
MQMFRFHYHRIAMRIPVTLTIILAACSSAETEQQTPAAAAAPPAADSVSLDEFRQIHWIAGSWQGSGGAYPSFFEEYRLVDDSTIQMRALSDSTFSVATDSSRIEWRNGAVHSRGNDRRYVVIALSADSIRFMREGQSTGGHTFRRVSADEWTATLHPANSAGQPTVYIMRRMRR